MAKRRGLLSCRWVKMKRNLRDGEVRRIECVKWTGTGSAPRLLRSGQHPQRIYTALQVLHPVIGKASERVWSEESNARYDTYRVRHFDIDVGDGVQADTCQTNQGIFREIR